MIYSDSRKYFRDFGINWVMVEVTNYCNMHCSFCPSSNLIRAKKFIDLDLFKKIIDQIYNLNPPNPIALHVLGEPLLHPKIFDLIDYCGEKKVKVYLFSNGIILKNHIKSICERDNIEAIAISYHTPAEKTYKKLRKCSKKFFDYKKDIFDSLEYFIDCGANRKMRFEIHLANTSHLPEFLGWEIFESNEHAIRIMKELGFEIKQLYFKNNNSYDKEKITKLIEDDFLELPQNILETSELNEYFGYQVIPNVYIRMKKFGTFGAFPSMLPKNVRIIENVQNKICLINKMNGEYFCVLVDGTISCCCLDAEGELAIGCVNDISFLEALRSPQRISILEDISRYQVCRRCSGEMEVFP